MDKKVVHLKSDFRLTTRFVGTYLPLEVHKKLRLLAAKEGTSACQITRRAVEAYLKAKRL